MLYSDAEPGLAWNQTQAWLKRQKHIAHNITLRHAPVAVRMLWINQEPDLQRHTRHGQEVVGGRRWRGERVQRKHISRNTLMTPNDAGKKENQTEVKTQMESIRKNRQPATSDRRGGQGQGCRQEEVREGLHARLERRDLHRPERIKRKRRRGSH